MPKKIVDAPKCNLGKALVTLVLLVLCLVLAFLIIRHSVKMLSSSDSTEQYAPTQQSMHLVNSERILAVPETYGKSKCFDCEKEVGAGGNPSSCFSCDRQVRPNPDTCFSCQR